MLSIIGGAWTPSSGTSEDYGIQLKSAHYTFFIHFSTFVKFSSVVFNDEVKKTFTYLELFVWYRVFREAADTGHGYFSQ